MPGLTKNTSNRRSADDQRGQLVLPLGKPKRGGEVEAVAIGRRVVMVRIVRHPRSRRYVLRVLADDTVRLTIPAFGSRASAFSFLRRELPWIERQRYAVARQRGTVLFRGVLLPLETYEDAHGERRWVRFGDESAALRQGETPKTAACRRLREIAGHRLKPRLSALAMQFKLPIGRVTIRSQQTRWGSCSPEGAIALNWRLVQMPDDVSDYILIHELMHMRQRNHSRRFWALVERACPDYKAARRWLKTHEAELM